MTLVLACIYLIAILFMKAILSGDVNPNTMAW